MKALRTAVVGLGWAGRFLWAERVLVHPDFELVAVVDPDPLARAAFSGPDDVLVLESLDDLPEVDLAVVAVPNHLHGPVACDLLRRGLSVFVEKPVCLSALEAGDLAAAERSGGGVLLAGSAAHYRSDILALNALVGSLGELRHIEASWVRASGVPGAGGWFTDRRRSGGGALVDLGWHLLDIVMPLLGTAAIAQVAASVSADLVANRSSSSRWRQDTDGEGRFDVEDTARGFLVTDTGVSVTLQASWASHQACDATRLRLYGKNGEAQLICTFGFSPDRVDASELTVTRAGVTEQIALPRDDIGAEYDRQLDDIPLQLAAARTSGAVARQAAATIALIERMYAVAPPLSI